jgi:hypothetical protein
MRCGARRFVVFQMQLRQLRDIRRNPPRLVAGELPFCPPSSFTPWPVEDLGGWLASPDILPDRYRLARNAR